jgi:hypothetical protein
MAIESCGLPIHFRITGGEVHDCKEAPKLITEYLRLIILLLTEAMIVKT